MEKENIDQDQDVQDPNGQQNAQDTGNDSQGDQGNQETNDFIEFQGVKVPQTEFEKIAKERFKDAFDAFENKSKWQAENTKKAMELAQDRRDAEAFRRLQQDPRYQQMNNPPPQNRFEAEKQKYVERKSKLFPEVDPRFFESQFEDLYEMSGKRAQETVSPILQQQSEEWERRFLQDHPAIEKNSDKYYELAGLLEKGYDPEHAYRIVYHDELLNKTLEDKLKARDEEAKRKLKQNSTPSSASGSKPRSADDAFERAWAKHGDS